MSESALTLHSLELEDRPKLKITKYARMGEEKTKMTKETKTPEITKAPKPKYSKTLGEHVKDIVIAVLITAIVAFIGGMMFQNKQQHAIETAVKAVTPIAQAQEVPAKK